MFPDRSHRGKLVSLHQTWNTARTLQSQRVVAVRHSSLLFGHALAYICIPSPGTFTPGYLCWKPLNGGKKGNLENKLPYSDSVLSAFWLLSLTLLPTAGSYKTAEAFSVWFPQQEDDPQIWCWFTWPSISMLFHGGKWNTGVNTCSGFSLLLTLLQWVFWLKSPLWLSFWL